MSNHCEGKQIWDWVMNYRRRLRIDLQRLFVHNRPTNLPFIQNMLSYRHAFHAGNHADVLKHSILIYCLRHLLKKEKSFLYVDTHAGAGLYDLASEYAELRKEYAEGISILREARDLPPILQDYVDIVSGFNSGGGSSRYPGSPLIAKTLLRPKDQMRLHELHTHDYEILSSHTSADPRVTLMNKDGLRGMIKAFPPPSRRALALIDPPYEMKSDYELLPFAIDDALFKFAEAMILLWYPLIESGLHNPLLENLGKLTVQKWLRVELRVRSPGKGLYGSGMWIANPPWDLPEAIRSIEQLLPELLGQDPRAVLKLDYQIP